MVGFNTRFSPLVQQLKTFLEDIKDFKSFVYTINSGFINPEHWIQNPEIGGGRFLGEACHFVDLIKYLVDQPIISLDVNFARDINQMNDTFSINLSFKDGSIGSINYFSNGHKSYPKENLEVFSSGKIFKLNNFRSLSAWGQRGFSRNKLLKQNKGQIECATSFVNAINSSAASPIDFADIYYT